MGRGNDVTEWQCDFCGKNTHAIVGHTPGTWVEIKTNGPEHVGGWAMCHDCWLHLGVEIEIAMDEQRARFKRLLFDSKRTNREGQWGAMMWGVYEDECSCCGKKVVIVATVHSVAEGYSEWHNGLRLCSGCKGDDD